MLALKLEGAKLHYRADIDGLRAVAVLPVLLFHAGIPGFSGGFVGVDVFFVISGYLITSLIAAETAAGTFSIASFYERRIRRIFPALFTVVATCIVVASIVFLPLDLIAFGKSVGATALFSSNILFWSEAGYFDAAVHTKPLLHTWSLAVEEQFYIAFPLFMMWMRGSARMPLILAMMALSFAASVWGVTHVPSATFYLAPTRAWELLLGSALALGLAPRPTSAWQTQCAGLLGLGMISFAVLRFNGQTPFPGANALLPCLGAALVIYAGNGPSVASRLLALPPLVYVGLISYSLYLWHWPVLAFAKYVAIEELNLGLRAGLLALSFVLAVLSLHFIERPLRKPQSASQRAWVFAGAFVAIAGAIGWGVIANLTHGLPSRLSPTIAAYAAASEDIDPRQNECLASPKLWIDPADACVFGQAVEPSIALWTDSHGDPFAVPTGELAARHGASIRLYAYSGCPPVPGLRRVDQPDHRCADHNKAVLETILRSPVSTVVIVARHTAFLDGPPPYNAIEKGFGPMVIAPAEGPQLAGDDLRRYYAARLADAVSRLQASGKRVVLVYPIPETAYDIPRTAARLALARQDVAQLGPTTAQIVERNRFVTQMLDEIQGPGISRIYPQDVLCDQARCHVVQDGKLLYADDDHLSLAGARLLLPQLERALFP